MDCRNITRGMMTSIDFTDVARGYARRLEDREAARSGSSVHVARMSVARRLHMSPGTLENLRNGRMKNVAAGIFAKLRSMVEHEINQEIQALEHELQMARACGLDRRDDEISAAEAALQTARSFLNKG